MGSVVAVTDNDGTLLSKQRYLPFGQVQEDVGTIAQTDFGYTGQRSLNEGMGGLMDYKARFYDPYLNRFIQADSVVPNLGNPQALNRFSYTANNPVRFNDPTGHAWDDCGERSGYQCQIHMKHVNRAIAESCRRDHHYCRLNNGAMIDVTHYAGDLAEDFWNKLTSAYEDGKTTFIYWFEQPAERGGIGGIFRSKFTFALSQIRDVNELAQVGAGAWWSFQIRFELWEASIFPPMSGWHSSFKNEDIPTTYIAYAAEVNGWDFDQAIIEAGGGPAYAASSQVESLFRSTPLCVQDALCDSSTPRNSSIYLKVQGNNDIWTLLAYSSAFPVPLTDPKYFQYGGCVSDVISGFGCRSQ